MNITALKVTPLGLLYVLLLLVLMGCGASAKKNSAPLPGSPPPGTEIEIAELERAILALGPGIDPSEAAMAARAAYEHTYDLAIEYEITDPALIHNIKVNLGVKPRGLCKHWAQDMEKRLIAEGFQTLTIHRAIGELAGVDHSTAIISRKGEDMYQGIVVDPWRDAGRLTWIATSEDTLWDWRPQFAVLDQFAFEAATERGRKSIIFTPEASDTPRCLVLTERNDYAPSTTNLSACGMQPLSDLSPAKGEELTP